jgi:hypothetical protein
MEETILLWGKIVFLLKINSGRNTPFTPIIPLLGQTSTLPLLEV